MENESTVDPGYQFSVDMGVSVDSLHANIMRKMKLFPSRPAPRPASLLEGL